MEPVYDGAEEMAEDGSPPDTIDGVSKPHKPKTSKNKDGRSSRSERSVFNVELGHALMYQDGTMGGCSEGWNETFKKDMSGDHLPSLIFPPDYNHVTTRLQLLEAVNLTAKVSVRFGRVTDNSLFKVGLVIWRTTEPGATAKLCIYGPVRECGLVKDALDRLNAKLLGKRGQKTSGRSHHRTTRTASGSFKSHLRNVPEGAEDVHSILDSLDEKSSSSDQRRSPGSSSSRDGPTMLGPLVEDPTEDPDAMSPCASSTGHKGKISFDEMDSLGILSHYMDERVLRHIDVTERQDAINQVASALIQLSSSKVPWNPYTSWSCTRCGSAHDEIHEQCIMCGLER